MQLTYVEETALTEDVDIQILAGKLFDPIDLNYISHRLIVVCRQRGIITDVREFSKDEEDVLLRQKNTIDLRGQTVFPGFVDAHVHFFLHPYSETSWDDQATRESVVERTVRAVTHAKRTLLAGFTAVRDLGTEGAGDADISLRKCLSGPDSLIPGPRYFCANRAIVTTGSYGPKGVHNMNKEGVDGITGAEAADGPSQCRQAVRRQVGAGADWIKSRMGRAAPKISSKAITTFLPDELRDIGDTVDQLGVKIAVHLNENITAKKLLKSITPNSIEHGTNLEYSELRELAQRGIFWVPTLAAYHSSAIRTGDASRWESAQVAFKQGLRLSNLKIACGGDTGVFPHGDNALEMKMMFRLGANPKNILRSATLYGWECIRGMQWEGNDGEERIKQLPNLREDISVNGDNDMPFGVIRPGWAADIIATKEDPEKDFEKAITATNISFVMKNGIVYKLGGAEVVVH
ncbi:hypothetical protein Clacol_007741 [Clathrus columnatus]|uniref:Amidohydrolase-related domain-containing protein n=1 Tax=Clathrus columnatus TaxID=1419009 RepID=A0AAV5AFS3_9AGAM|nr:hypothetical protein Clacol_007741 [Clathrus columnatus]